MAANIEQVAIVLVGGAQLTIYQDGDTATIVCDRDVEIEINQHSREIELSVASEKPRGRRVKLVLRE